MLKRKHVLLASLTLNLLLAGVLLGQLATPTWHSKRSHYMERKIERIVNALPEQQQDRARVEYEGALENARLGRETFKDLQDELHIILTAESFDEDAYDAKLREVQEARQQSWQRFVDVTKSLAKELSQPEREALAEALKHKKR